MPAPVTALRITVLPADPHAGTAVLHRLHTWLVQNADVGAAAMAESAAAVQAACSLLRPARLSRIKRSLVAAVCSSGDVLHVEAAADARAACARVIDGAGGIAYAPPTKQEVAATGASTAQARPAEARRPAALLLHGMTVGDVLTGRHALWSAQRDAGVLRPLPLSAALPAVAAHVDDACLLPIHHTCQSPEALKEQFRMPEKLERYRGKLRYLPTPTCPLCWRNDNLKEELGPGHIRATIPVLYAAGYDAGHLLLRHAEHGLARAVTDFRAAGSRRGRCRTGTSDEPQRPREAKRRRTGESDGAP